MFSYNAGISTIGATFIDIIHHLAFLIIRVFYNICNSLETLISYMVGSTFLESFFNSSIVTSIYSFSLSLGVVFLILFGGWQILKRNLEPDKSAPLGSIVWEILKCGVIISCWGLVFTTAYNLSSIVQDGLISTVNEASNVSSIADSLITSFTTSNYCESDDDCLLTDSEAQAFVANSLKVDSDSCGNNIVLSSISGTNITPVENPFTGNIHKDASCGVLEDNGTGTGYQPNNIDCYLLTSTKITVAGLFGEGVLNYTNANGKSLDSHKIWALDRGNGLEYYVWDGTKGDAGEYIDITTEVEEILKKVYIDENDSSCFYVGKAQYCSEDPNITFTSVVEKTDGIYVLFEYVPANIAGYNHSLNASSTSINESSSNVYTGSINTSKSNTWSWDDDSFLRAYSVTTTLTYRENFDVSDVSSQLLTSIDATVSNVSFWGCSGSVSVPPVYNLRGSDEDTAEDLITAALNKKADDDYDYIFNMHTPYLLVTIIFFTIALLTTIFSLFTRVFELVILFVIAPAVIGSSICRQETRSNLWKMLSSLLLQSLGTVLILYFGISFMSTIASYSSSDWGVLTTIIFKMAGIIAVGFAMMRGSKVIQTFISEQSGIGQGITGTLGALGAMAGVGMAASRGIKGAAGLALTSPAGIDDARRALSTHSIQKELGTTTSKLGSMDLNDPNYGTTLERARGLQTSLQNKISENTIAQSTSVGGRGVANKLAQKGDKLMGHTPRQLNSKADSRLIQSENIISSSQGGGINQTINSNSVIQSTSPSPSPTPNPNQSIQQSTMPAETVAKTNSSSKNNIASNITHQAAASAINDIKQESNQGGNK